METKTMLVSELRSHIIKMIKALDGYIDENFYSEEIISDNLILKEEVVDGSVQMRAYLKEDYEYDLFNNLLYDEQLNKFYHYTSFASLFEILKSGKLHLSSLIGLNDRSEVNFVNSFMGRTFSDPNHPSTIAYHNTHFIFCLSENKDQLNQWRLYGDDGAGVMLEFEIDHNHFPYKEMKISKVSYDLKLFEMIKEWLRFCKKDLNIGFGFHQIDYWKFFYKDADYKDENEVRYLIRNPLSKENPAYTEEDYKLNRYGIIVPYLEVSCIGSDYGLIRLKNIMLGPRCNESGLKMAQINYMISRKYPEHEVHVSKSRIDHYR